MYSDNPILNTGQSPQQNGAAGGGGGPMQNTGQTGTGPPGTNANGPPPNGFGTLGFVNPSYVDPNQNQAYMNQYEQLFRQSVEPYYKEQQLAEQGQLAGRGISNSGSGQYLMNDLMGQQAASTAQGLMPIVQQGYGYTQQDLQGNQNAANQASYFNAGTWNNYQQGLEQAYLGSYGPNAGVEAAYGSAVGGLGNTYGSIYGSALGEQGQALGSAGYAAGMFGGGGGGGAPSAPPNYAGPWGG